MNKTALKRGFHYDDQSGSMGLWVEGTLVKDYIAEQGRTFYVNNITGGSTAGGQSWGDAFAQPSQAITAAAAYLATHTANNRFVLNNIMVQGTATAYTGITTLPSYCRLVGVGANPYGHAAGIPRLGADDMTGSGQQGMKGASATTGDVRGLYTSGIQWQCNYNGECFKVRHIYRSTIEDSSFFVAGGTIGTIQKGISITGNAGGLHVRDCLWGTNASRTAIMVHGFYIAGTRFMNCLVEDCRIAGSSTGVYVISTMVNGQGSVFSNCSIGDLGNAPCIKAIDDNAVTGSGGGISYQGCYVNGTDPIEVSNDAKRFVGCIAEVAMVQT